MLLNVQSQKNMQLIDTNVILRVILNDIPEQASQAVSIIENGAYTKPEIIAEVVYVLSGVYSASREKVKSYIHSILEVVLCENSECILYAIDLYAETSLDFVDCLLIAYHKINNETIFSFDKKLNKHLF